MDSGAVESQERRIEASDQFGVVGGTVAYANQISSAQTWFAGGERISYDPKARAILAGGDAPLRIFLRREGDHAQAVSFLPGFPDGSKEPHRQRPFEGAWAMI